MLHFLQLFAVVDKLSNRSGTVIYIPGLIVQAAMTLGNYPATLAGNGVEYCKAGSKIVEYFVR
jgi:hypothetical protein